MSSDVSRHRANLALLLNDSHVYSNFAEFLPGVADEIARIDFSLLPALNSRPLAEQADALVAAFDSAADLVTAKAPPAPDPLPAFAAAIRGALDPRALSQVLNTSPPSAPNSPRERALLYFLLSLIARAANPHAVVRWLGRAAAAPDWHAPLARHFLKAFCVCTVRGDPARRKGHPGDAATHWATLDHANKFELFRFGDADLEPCGSAQLGEVGRGRTPRSLRIVAATGEPFGEIEPVEERQVALWLQAVQSPQTAAVPHEIFFRHRLVPDSFYYSFYQALVSDDLVLLRTFGHFSVCKIAEGMPVARAFLDIFAYAGKVNALLTALGALDFESDALQTTAVLRTNSHLTNMFKVFVSKFGTDYFNGLVTKLMDFILQAGDLKLKTLEQCDKMRVQRMIVGSIKAVLKSGGLVPVHIRHLAFVLKSLAAVRFNRKQAIYNTLAGFFYLRFLIGAMMDATLFEGYRPPPADVQATVLIPFAQMLQTPLNLNVYSARYDIFADWNHHFIKHVFPELMAFTWGLADLDGVPEYPAPDQMAVQRALGVLLDCMIKNKEAFEERYRDLTAAGTKQVSPVSWSFSSFLISFFKSE
jgi:hypothetical protein